MYTEIERPEVQVNRNNQVDWCDNTLRAMADTGVFYVVNGRVALVIPEEHDPLVVTVRLLETRVALRSWLNRYIKFTKRVFENGRPQQVECVAPSSLASEIANRNTYKGGLKHIVFDGCYCHPNAVYSVVSYPGEALVLRVSSKSSSEKEAA